MAIYPLNIFTPDPVSKSVRPFVIFIASEIKWNIQKSLSYESVKPISVLKGGFVLPMPAGGLVDSSTNQFSEEPGFLSSYTVGAQDTINGATNKAAQRLGLNADPKLTQIYQGTSSRKWSGTWQLIPQSIGESAAIAFILWEVKRLAAPSAPITSEKVGILTPPCVFRIIFSNPAIQLAMQFDKMAIESYSINFFAQGYASTYWDMMPKQIELSMSFAEFGIKTRQDWEKLPWN